MNADEQVSIDRTVLADVEQFLVRLADYPETVRRVEESLDCGDFYKHLREHLAHALGSGPRPTAIRWNRNPRQ